MAGKVPERQEQGVIKAINAAVKANKKRPITVVTNGESIDNVIEAKKYMGRQASGSEPYIDVVFVRKNKKDQNLSLKGEAAPSLAGGGLRGLETIAPGVVTKFMKAAHKKLLRSGVKKGDKVPDVYGKIDNSSKAKIVIGNKVMGGPIDYMYVGPMDVKHTFDEKKQTLTLNGKLTNSAKYAKEHELYLRLRARREDQTFDPDIMDGSIPKIYSRSPSRGDSAGRIVVTSSVPKDALKVNIS